MNELSLYKKTMCHSHRIVEATTIVLTAFVYCSQSQIVTYEKLDRWCSLAEGGIDMCKYGSHQEMISRLEKLVTNNAERADIGE